VLDAAGELMRERGWDKVRMADVADLAGISRQTLYVEFGSREALAQEAVLREVVRFLDGIEGALKEHADDAQAAVAAAFQAFLLAVAENQLLRALVLDDNNEELLPYLTTHGTPILDAARERLSSFVLGTWPDTDPAECELLSEAVVRLAISVATLPGRQLLVTPDAVARMIGPFARRITGTG
jgi:AcrR family transcriptional regulator